MFEGFAFAAILSCSLFAGAALYINLAEHPARMECGTALAATVFKPSYRRAAVMQASLATRCRPDIFSNSLHAYRDLPDEPTIARFRLGP